MSNYVNNGFMWITKGVELDDVELNNWSVHKKVLQNFPGPTRMC